MTTKNENRARYSIRRVFSHLDTKSSREIIRLNGGKTEKAEGERVCEMSTTSSSKLDVENYSRVLFIRFENGVNEIRERRRRWREENSRGNCD